MQPFNIRFYVLFLSSSGPGQVKVRVRWGFPKVTVYPPKNTYTDLNYNLMLAENFTLTEEMRNELITCSLHIISEHTFMDDFDKLQEDER